MAELEPAAKRSVFGNFEPAPAPRPPAPETPETLPGPNQSDAAATALARAFLHQFLARSFAYPEPETWAWMHSESTKSLLRAAVLSLAGDAASEWPELLDGLLAELQSYRFDALHDDYILAIGHAARGSCPINEIEYGDLKADPLFQPHRLANLAAFYRAFGVELGTGANERLDHISVELEFMAVLAAQEATARQQPAPEAVEGMAVCLEAQRKFLRDHLGRWSPTFTRRLRAMVGDGPLGRLALVALAFIQDECRRAGVQPGGGDLVLRPVDEAASLCEDCGLASSLPGAPAAANP